MKGAFEKTVTWFINLFIREEPYIYIVLPAIFFLLIVGFFTLIGVGLK